METYFDNMTAEDGSKEKLAHDFKILASDSKQVLLNVGQATAATVKAEVKAVDATIHKHPYAAMLVGFGLGLAAGYLLGPSRD